MKILLTGVPVGTDYVPQVNEVIFDTVTGARYMGKNYTALSSLPVIASDQSLWIPATDFVASAAGPALEVVDAIHHGFLLDDTSSEVVSSGRFIPTGWNTMVATYYGYNATADAGDVVLGIYVEDNADGSSLVSETPTIVTDVTFTAGSEDTMDINAGTTTIVVTPGTYHSIKVGRLPALAGDTKTGDWGLLGVLLSKVT